MPREQVQGLQVGNHNVQINVFAPAETAPVLSPTAPPGWSEDPALIQKVSQTADLLVARQEGLYIGGQELPRPESERAFEALAGGQKVLIAGGAGSGKSVVLSQVIRRARDEGWPVLALSADSAAASAATARAWGAALGLPDSPSAVLAQLAGSGAGLVVIDQVDAVGAVSGRHEERRELIEQIVHDASGAAGIRVLLACRTFDLDHDRVLRHIAGGPNAVQVTIADLDEQMVRDVLARCSSPVPGVSPALLSLLRVPLHLALYVEMLTNGADPGPVGALVDLYRRYCEEKRTACRNARAGRDDWQQVVEILITRMDDERELWAPSALLSGFAAQRDAMISAGVLVSEGHQVRFFHESLCDYFFAEQLVLRGHTLQELLSTGEQDLFRRAQVRQVLNYERTGDFPAYLRDMQWLLNASEVRFHLKVLAVILNQITPDPRPQEWSLLHPIANDPAHPLHDRLWAALRANPAWFPLIEATGAWSRWMSSPDPQVINRTVWAISAMAGAWPGPIVALMQSLPPGPSSDGWMRMFLQHAEVGRDRRLVDLTVHAVAAGLFDADGTTTIWETLDTVAAHQPAWAVDLLHALLARLLATFPALPADAREPDFRLPGPWAAAFGHGGETAIAVAAQQEPALLAERLLPLVVQVLRRCAQTPRAGGSLRPDRVVTRRIDAPRTLMDELVRVLAESLAVMAVGAPARLDPLLRVLEAEPDLESCAVLMARAWAGNPSAHADRAATWLIATPGALDLGYADTPHWISRELIAAISPHWSPLPGEQLIDAVLFRTPVRERSVRAREWRGTAELCLLSGIAIHRRPPRVQRRIAELRRKLLVEDTPPPRRRDDYIRVLVPIPEERARRMSEQQWLRAILIHGDTKGCGPVGRPGSGEAEQQAHVLDALTRQDPERFARLVLQMPAGSSVAYVSAVMNGISGEALDPALILDVVRQVEHLGGPQLTPAILWLIESQALRHLPEELLAIVARTALTDPDPIEDLGWQEGTDLGSAGLASARGIAAYVIGTLLQHDPARASVFTAALLALVKDGNLPVRYAAIGALSPLFAADSGAALACFRVAISADEHLLATDNVDHFLRTVLRGGRYADIADVLARMSGSALAVVRRSGARHLALASLGRSDLDPAVDALVGGTDKEVRSGIAETFAAYAWQQQRPDRCMAGLTSAFHDSSASVREAAAHCFTTIGERPWGDRARTLSSAFITSRAFTAHAEDFLRSADRTLHPLPPWVLDACERYLNPFAPSRASARSMASAPGYHLVRILIRIHTQNREPAVRRRCLDLLDELLLLRAHNIDDAIAAIER